MTVPDVVPTTQRTPHPLHARTLTVADVTELSATMRRVVFELDPDDPDVPMVAMAPTDHVKLVFPDESGRIRTPAVVDDRPVRGDGPPPVMRDYTIRAAGAGTLTIDFVVHEHGPAGRWAATARPGDRLGALGPRGSVRFPDRYRRYVLAGDDAAIPALARWIEELPQGAEVEMIVEVAGAASEQPLPGHDRLAVRWVHRATGGTLADALQTVAIADDTFVFIAGEASQLVGIRRRLVHTLGVDRRRVDVDGYWRTGVAGLDHHAPLDPDED